MKKPRVRFCWECGRKLRGNHHKELFIDGHWRTLHKQCAKEYKGCPEKPKGSDIFKGTGAPAAEVCQGMGV